MKERACVANAEAGEPMLSGWLMLLIAFAYLGLLFAIAFYADMRSDAGRSIISNPYIYTLSIAVYCTAWTFYGSVGRAAGSGVGFLPIYLGPTLMACLWWFVLRKIVRISKVHRITSIADFIGSRYGKSALVGGVVTVIAVVGIMPYISLQLKAIAVSSNVLLTYPQIADNAATRAFYADTALYVALALAAFTILFGTRHIDTTERHEGMVAAIAFESLIKLIAFLAVGLFVVFVLFSGPGDLFAKAAAVPEVARLFSFDAMPGSYASWLSLTFLAMMAIMFLPRQFQVLVVENVNETHIRKASWLFPLYLLLINLFVLPIAIAGLILFPQGSIDPDTFVLTLPMTESAEFLALFAFIGGLSAATGMVIVATIAISTMVCNDLVIPFLLRMRLLHREDMSGLLLAIRRGAIIAILLLGYLYFQLIGESYALVTIGLVSFAAAAQFAPPILIGIYWKGASRVGAVAGLLGGFLVWAYTLVIPGFALSGWLPQTFLEEGLFGWSWLRPYQLLGLDLFDPITHAVFWSMLVNVGLLVGVSLFANQSAIERIQATLFVDVFRQGSQTRDSRIWESTSSVSEIREILARFIGVEQAAKAFQEFALVEGQSLKDEAPAESGLVEYAERQLAGAIGAASARVMMGTVVKGEELSIEGVMKILDETSQVLEYSRQLEQKSQELEAATGKLKAANERLKELDRLKDDFVSTVSHELRTPLTSIRAFSEILRDSPEMPATQRQEFLDIIVKENERLTRLINEVLDLAKIESESVEWEMQSTDLREAIEEALVATQQLVAESGTVLYKDMTNQAVQVTVDKDRLIQVVINLISNAVKFCDGNRGRIWVRVYARNGMANVEVSDNGCGIAPAEQERIFEKFHQVSDVQEGKPRGSGLGLPICRKIVEHHGGRIWVESELDKGSVFKFVLPMEANA
ncbi:sensor histidine kinase [Candidatus Thiodiazotropha endoloripes]|uniref:sensor histidine kinase n=1 Tax=Candidatus Thiodiazotropha endoloripes TaxID=1818881 RepID=UPI00273971C5|nr:sensor histidine kinase [Candidatus Thiodiazotropha endoloripes]